MKLTGKAKIEFEKWLIDSHDTSHNKNVLNGKIGQSFSECFYKLTESMQYGVLIDFFDSVGIIIDTQPFMDYDEHVYTNIINWSAIVIVLNKEPKEGNYIHDIKTRQEARTEAIKKANEIYNLS
ncbi:MAG: hypothetical protein GY739_11835 [Mesoflavibacter sp.]|nr:hypothetical protein [Mesoflavibacter sp.]